MTPQLWQKVRQTVDALLALEGSQRERQLAQLWRDDPTLAAEVDSLLGRRDTPHSGPNDGTGDLPAPTTCEGSQLPPAGPVAAEVVTHIGPYSLQEKVGQGGMGIVWRARDRLFHRSLAVKVLAEQHTHNGELRRRFIEEAQLMGQLQHPGIPPVHDLGELPDGRPYFAMKLIKGKTLAALLKERTGPDQEQPRLLAIFEQVCQTLAYAHAQRILHRDLKPSNIMVGAFGEVQVMDWGLAKLLGSAGEKTEQAVAPASTIYTVRTDEPDTATQTGQALGTPAYMAPEQARGETGLLDERCDVFGLGAILCEILTGQPAFIGRNTKEVLHSAQQGDTAVALARLEQSGADRELVQLARHCLAADRRDRPADAGATARALTAYLVHVQERLRQAELERKAAEVRAAEERKRRRVAFRLGSVIALLIMALGMAGWWADRSATQARSEREEQHLRARQAAESLFEQADLALAAGKGDRAEQALRLVRDRLADLDAADLVERLAETQRDLAMLRELQRLFSRRWLVVQQLVLEQLQSGQREGTRTETPPGLVSAGNMPAVSKAELRQDYAAAFARYGLAPGQGPAADLAERVRQSRISRALIDALDQWFLIEPDSATLLAALSLLDAPRQTARQLLADRAAGKAPGMQPAKIENEQHEPAMVLYLSELLPDERAIALLKKSVERFPDDHRLLTVLVYRLLLSQPVRATEALGYARAAYALEPRNVFPCLLVAEALGETGQWDESLRHGQRAVDLDDKNTAAHNALAMAYVQKEDYDRAIAHLHKALELNPKNAYAHSALGFTYNKQGDHDRAIPHLRKVIDLEPRNAAAHNNLGIAYAKKGDFQKAIPYLEKAIALEPKTFESHGTLGYICNEKGDYDQAIVHLQKTILLDPKNAAAHNNLGISYARKGDYEQAIPYLEKAIAFDPHNVNSHGTLGYIYNEKGDHDRAIPYLKKAIDLEPKNAAAHNNLGIAYAKKGNHDQAIAHLEMAIALDPKNFNGYGTLGFIYNEKGDPDRAIPYLQKVIDLEPNNAAAHNNLGIAYAKKGDYERAVFHLEKAITLEPNNVNSHGTLGYICNMKGDYNRAIACLQKVIKLDPKNATAYNNLGYACTRKGDCEQAVVYLKKAINLDAKNATAHETLFIALFELGRLTEARAVGEQVLGLTAANSPQWQAQKKAMQALEAQLDLEPRLQDIVRGETKPKSFAEGMQFGRLCRLKQYVAAASRLYDQALMLDPTAGKKLTPPDLLTLARVNLLAAAGMGNDPPPQAERAGYRARALPWLRQYLQICRQALEKNPGSFRYAVQQAVRLLTQHADLASVRPPALDSLPEDERRPWQAFWKDVQTLLERADVPADPEKR
jgi:Flp pilus assembly protein TadD/serine/threonine protein kinase